MVATRYPSGWKEPRGACKANQGAARAAGIIADLGTPCIAIPAAALFVPASIAAFRIDKMRHDNQLFAYQSVEAYLAGEDPDVGNRFNQRAGEHWVSRRVALTVVGIIVGLCCGWGAAGIISRLLGG